MYNIKYEIPDITLDNSKNINIVSNLKQNIDHYKEENMHKIKENVGMKYTSI